MKRATLATLAPGTRFHIPSTGRTGTLISVSEYRARVRYDNDARHVELSDGVSFDTPGRALDISPRTEVTELAPEVTRTNYPLVPETGETAMKNTEYQPKTGARCSCRRGVERDNCATCEGTGMVIDFAQIRAQINHDDEHGENIGHASVDCACCPQPRAK